MDPRSVFPTLLPSEAKATATEQLSNQFAAGQFTANQVAASQVTAGQPATDPLPAGQPPEGLAPIAQRLAGAHQTHRGVRRRPPLYGDLPALADFLALIHQDFLDSAETDLLVTFAGEWMLDNYYVIQQALRQVKFDLSPKYYAELTVLGGDDALSGYPRIYAVAIALLDAVDGQLDQDRIIQFILAYQERQPLETGELWALPIMLRLATLQRIALAGDRLVGRPPASRLPTSLHAFQAAFQPDAPASVESEEAAIAHAIPTLRFIDALDWAEMFEHLSLMHQMLRRDPSGVYAHLDPATLDRYRHSIETLHRRVAASEVEIAQVAVELATQAFDALPAAERPALDPTTAHPALNIDLPRAATVGHYLIGEGRPLLERRIGYRPSLRQRASRWLFAHASALYFALVGVASLAVMGAFLLLAGGSVWASGAVLLLACVPALTAGVGFANWVITHTVAPRILPKLDFHTAIPAACRTALVVPTLIDSATDIDHLVDELEQHFLRNPDPQLVYVLLTDFVDADHETEERDVALLAHAQNAIERLNDKVAHAPFYLLHRRRLWNPSQQKWMGWERKRGKLHEFNRLIRGAEETSFAWRFGAMTQLGAIRYVITLDADTILPRDGAAALIGALAHPLNHARFDEATGKVVAGYTVLQPRAEIKPVSAGRSLFTRIFAGSSALDLYTLASSDLYQDLFGAGIFVGKGIYEVDAFERSLHDRVPPNALLSHDLFEGIHGRAGLVSDIVVYEEYPSHYLLTTQRSHRWVRGDWQLLPWLLPHVPYASGRAPNDLSAIDRWKIFDNLRRSLFAPAMLALLIAGWTVLPGSPLLWTALGLLFPVASVASSLLSSARQTLHNWRLWRNVVWALRDGALRWLLFLAFLPYESQLHLDAIVRTLARVFVTRRWMLEWTSAAHATRLHHSGGRQVALRKMLPTVLFTSVLAIWIGLMRPTALLIALPFLTTWIVGPQLADWISRPASQPAPRPTAAEARTLRAIARRTWMFYENFVGPNDNWLPPDHFQEAPGGVVAHATSPTNVGFYLLSTLAAFDFGYIRLANFVLRATFAFDALDRQPRYRGHFLNWIDTRNLQPLPPPYVSTVDSGNLSAALIALQQGCLELRSHPVWRPARWQGLLDTLAIVVEATRSLTPEDDPRRAPVQRLQAALAAMIEQVEQALAQPDSAPMILANLLGLHKEALDRALLEVVADEPNPIEADTLQTLRLYVLRVHQHVEGMSQERAELMPWLAVMATRPPLFSAGDCPESLRDAWAALVKSLPADPRLDELDAAMQQARRQLEQVRLLLDQPGAAPAESVSRALAWCAELAGALDAAQTLAQSTLSDLAHLAERAQTFVDGMDFTFLYDPTSDLFHIGCNVNTGELDKNHYDLLASEARIASLLAIGQNAAPVKHWLHMGRPVTRLADGQQALLSWSGTMFEYLLPSLLLRTYPDTLWQQTYASVIERQIDFGREHDIPWGVSESGFYTFDAALRYQYRAFGVPGVGLQRGLGEDLVVAPYASILALPFHPRAVLHNLEHFAQLKMIGRFGLYEAVDYTPERLTLGRHHAIVHSYMAHHQGMILVGIANYLHDKRMIERFHAAPLIQSVDLLLQEQVPQNAPVQFPNAEEATRAQAISPAGEVAPWQPPIDTPMPQVHYLSNGCLSTLITNAGAGFCTGPKAMLTRWRADTTLDEWGCWVYVQDLDSGALWSVGRQPVGERSAYEQVTFHPHMAEFRRRADSISLHMELFIAPDADVEIRRVTVVNDSDAPRRIGLVSYGEVVLAAAGDDRRHPAFAKLFVESSHHAELPALLYQRRARAADEERVVMLHRLVQGPVAAAEAWGRSVFSADRARFIGRTGSQRSPAALESGRLWQRDWEGGAGATLDPIMALGQEITLAPHTSAQVAFVTLLADSRSGALALAQRYGAWAAIERAQTLAQNQARHEMRQLGFEGARFQQASQLLSLCLYPHPALRAAAETLAANVLGQSALWGFGISGDYPIMLVQCSEESHLALLQEMVQIHAFWRRRGIEVELVILNNHDTTYDQRLHNQLYRLIRRLGSDAWLNQRGGLFLLRRDQLSEAERILLESAARVLLDGARGALRDHLAELYRQPASLSRLAPVDLARQHQPRDGAHPGWLARPGTLQFDNGLGGFTPNGKEYVIYLPPGESTPTPWINVIANPEFGLMASDSGIGASWALNSGENRLTTWRNDPVTDTPSTILYLRDEESAAVWSPTPQPAPGAAPYLIRHGAGFTIYEHHSHALEQHLCLYIAPDAPVQIMRLRLQNRAPAPRHLTVTCYAELVLGVDRESTQAYLVPEYDHTHGAILARNPYATEFGARVAFLAASKLPVGVTADRTSFLGRLGSLRSPQALEKIGLANQVQAGADPCAALQLSVDLPAGGAEELFFILGQGADRQEALALVERFRQADAVDAAWGASNARWEHLLGALKVETPDAAMNLLLNRWLLYQTISCRLWGRSALYQSSGAYGFRDQLQDVLALLHAAPHLARTQILQAASRQFAAGDVLHWWHPPSGRGVRTRISDDLLWLPYVTARYIAATGDRAILDEQLPFLLAPELSPEEHDRYGHYRQTEATYALLEHCRRALQRGLTSGPHGIPLIGAGDWNDGMNRVGIEGKGESIWLGWFAIAVLTAFADVCDAAQLPGGDDYRRQAEQVRQAVERHGWDGGWYRRAYYDDGTPLGSAQNRECRIDAIAQSWGVLSGAADPQRARQAMDAVFEHLVKEPERLLLLFTPPLDKTPHDPGYIKGYLPGVRENGGQYTHAALWSIAAFAALGDAHRAHHLFQLINPILRSDTFAKAQQYKVEPYVISADVYNVAPHIGRGGWTWYTGSASWMVQVGIEAILGLHLSKDSLRLTPCLPPAWPGFTAKLRYGSSDYHIQVENGAVAGEGGDQITLDGEPWLGDSIPLRDDGQRHNIVLRLHAAPLPSQRELSGTQ